MGHGPGKLHQSHQLDKHLPAQVTLINLLFELVIDLFPDLWPLSVIYRQLRVAVLENLENSSNILGKLSSHVAEGCTRSCRRGSALTIAVSCAEQQFECVKAHAI